MPSPLDLAESYMKDQGIGEQSSRQSDAIDAVMFYIWSKGHLERGHLRAALITLFGWLPRSVIFILSVPLKFIEMAPALAFSVLVASFIYVAFEPAMSSIAFIPLTLATLSITKYNSLYTMIRNLMFDIGDVISLSMLSRAYIRKYLAFYRIKELNDKDGMKMFLFTTRLLQDGPHQRENDALQQFVSFLSQDQDTLAGEIDEYWRVGRNDLGYWQGRIAQLSKQERQE